MNEIRLTKNCGNGYLIVLTIVALLSANLAMAGQMELDSKNKVTTHNARKVLMKDASGENLWAVFDSENASFAIKDGNGKIRLRFQVDGKKPSIVFYDQKGKNRLKIGEFKNDQFGILFFNKDGTPGPSWTN